MLSLPSAACSVPREAPHVVVPVVADSSGLEITTSNLGYEITLHAVDLAIRDLEFAIAGEAHSSLWKEISEVIVPTAWAHPGHHQGGDITGELLGSFELRFEPNKTESLGTARLLVGDYRSMNFFFGRGEGEVLDGHTGIMRGSARNEAGDVEFTVVVDSPEDRQLEGVPFEQRVKEGAELVVGLRLLLQDSVDGTTLFDDVDFVLLDGDFDGLVHIEPGADDADTATAYNQIRRRFQTHNHFDVRIQG